MLNDVYEGRFGFRFVVFVAGRPLSAIGPLIEASMRNDRAAELARGLDDVIDIAADRLGRLRGEYPDRRGRRLMSYEIQYGKADVKVYRTYGTPLRGVRPIPESPFAGRENILMAAELEVDGPRHRLPRRLHPGRQPPGGGDRHDEELHARRLPGVRRRPRSRAGCTTSGRRSWRPTRTWSG